MPDDPDSQRPNAPPVFGAETPPGEGHGVRPPDPAPQPSDRTPGAEPDREEETRPVVSKRTRTTQIRKALEDILQLPAAAFDEDLLDDPWAEQHFMTQGKSLAAQIAEVSERNELVRRWCERLMVGDSLATLGIGALMYAYPPLVHFGAAPGIGPFAAIPVIGRPEPTYAPPPEGHDGAPHEDGGVPGAEGAPDHAAPPSAHTP